MLIQVGRLLQSLCRGWGGARRGGRGGGERAMSGTLRHRVTVFHARCCVAGRERQRADPFLLLYDDHHEFGQVVSFCLMRSDEK